MRVKILEVHEKDAFYGEKNIIGEFGTIKESEFTNGKTEDGFVNAHILIDGKSQTFYFYAVKYEEIK